MMPGTSLSQYGSPLMNKSGIRVRLRITKERNDAFGNQLHEWAFYPWFHSAWMKGPTLRVTNIPGS